VRRAVTNLAAAVEESQAEVRYEGLPTITADPTQMVQLFQNLISNAIKFRAETAPRIQIEAESRGREWLFSVRDNGIGIEPEDRESIFTLFKRLHSDYSGTGIGLSICQRIVERHGGKIWVDSIPAKGSIFYFTIPQRFRAVPVEDGR
jgi:signal transduction histidine kinase